MPSASRTSARSRSLSPRASRSRSIMMRNLIRGAALLAFVGLGACDKRLVVTNPNAPDAAKALSSPADLENFLGSYYKRWHSGMYGSLGNVWGMAAVQSFE